jgi:hypothetical protein
VRKPPAAAILATIKESTTDGIGDKPGRDNHAKHLAKLEPNFGARSKLVGLADMLAVCCTAHGSCRCGHSHSAIEPDGHAGLESGRIALWIEAQAQRIAVVVADCALGLPSGKGPQRQELSDERRQSFEDDARKNSWAKRALVRRRFLMPSFGVMMFLLFLIVGNWILMRPQ